MASCPGEDKLQKHDLVECIWLVKALDAIRSDTHFGTIELEVKNDIVVFRRKTMREHPNAD